MKRTLSFFLVLALIAGIFAGLKLPAEAANASYNKGKREEVCTSLSSAAQKYYTGSNTYEQLSALTGSSLRTKLRSLVNSGRSTVGYDGLKRYFPYTDAYEGSSSRLLLFYCNGTTTSSWDSAKTWNREHMWPDSKGGSAMEGDLHAMRPTDPNTNSTRGNSKYGEVNGGKEAHANTANGGLLGGYYTSGTFEPLDFAKGDCARTILYDYVVSSSMSSVTVVFQDVQTLLNWCALDPVDTYEMSRNDVAQEIQGCRNPFVDYPELAWVLMDQAIPGDLTTPSSGNGGSVPSYTITASSNDPAMGTVKVQDNTIVASPASGCYTAGYTILSGNATVSQNGNVFTVEAKSDCSIRINFAKKESLTVSFHGAAEAVTVYAGESITLPSAANVGDYEFAGWVEEEMEETTIKPDYRTAGSKYTVTSNKDFYALYTIEKGGHGTGKWTLVTREGQLSSGAQMVIAANEKGMTAGDINGTYMMPVASSFSSDMQTITNLSGETVILTLGGSKGAWTFTDAQGRQLGCSNKKTLGWGAGTLTWDIQIEEKGASIFSTMSDYGRILYNVSAPRFTTYTGNPATHLPLPQLYVMDGTAPVIYYTTNPKTETEACNHANAIFYAAVEATCTKTGTIAYYDCKACGKLFADAAFTEELSSADLVVPMKEHSYTSRITAPTCTEEGYTTYTCSMCGKSYTADTTEATGHNYVAQEGTTATCTEGGYGIFSCTVCGDSYQDAFTPALGHDWDEGKVVTAPTETEVGLMSYTCLRCEAVKTALIPALGTGSTTCEKGDACGVYTFEDMPAVDFWSHKGIDYVLEHELFIGMTESYFGLDVAMTRGMWVTVLWRQMNEPKAGECKFKDVAPDAWYAEAVAWAAENGIVMGISETEFRAEQEINREQLVTMLFRFANYCGMDTTARAELDAFSDAMYAYEYSMEPLKWAVATGLINGVSEVGTVYLRPQGLATRSQVATMLMRFLESNETVTD